MLNRRGFLGTAAAYGVGGLGMGAMAESRAGSAAAVSPFGDAVEIAGSPRERGRAYGRRFAAATRGFLDREIYGVFRDRFFPKDDLLRYAAACFREVRKECPIIADEMEGMAEGSGLTIEEHVLITLHEELYHRGVLPPVPHCTAIGLSPPETPGATYIAQTWDWMPSVAGTSSMLTWRRQEGPSLLAYAFPGLWAGAGLNSAGIALVWTSAALGKPKQMPRVGLPTYVMLAHLLYQPNLSEVAGAAKRNRHAGWFTIVLGDGEGRLLNVEGSPEGITCEESRGRLVRIGFGTRERSATPSTAQVPRHPRRVVTERLLDKTRGKTDAATLKGAFGNPAAGICDGKNTIDLMVFDTTRRAALLSRGPSYGVSWTEYQFKKA
jgi:hypothetical protein